MRVLSRFRDGGGLSLPPVSLARLLKVRGDVTPLPCTNKGLVYCIYGMLSPRCNEWIANYCGRTLLRLTRTHAWISRIGHCVRGEGLLERFLKTGVCGIRMRIQMCREKKDKAGSDAHSYISPKPLVHGYEHRLHIDETTYSSRTTTNCAGVVRERRGG